MEKFLVTDFRKFKKQGRKISMITAYDYPMASFARDAGIDVILVGDSLGMVVLGYESTTRVTMDVMIHHAKAARRGAVDTFMIGDMPFVSYGHDLKESILNAGRFISEGGCNAVKLEGGANMAETVEAINGVGIPVIGHLGYTPQSDNLFGAKKVRGRDPDLARKLVDDARTLEKAGICALILELVPYRLAEYITQCLSIPTIGIGSGWFCDGQVLVINDIFNLYGGFSPKHSKVYHDLGSIIRSSLERYAEEVRASEFPAVENSYDMDEEIIERIREEDGKTDQDNG